MLKDIIKDKPKIHTRNISLATYPHNKTEIIVEGILLDKSYQKIFTIAGSVKEPGIIHHMAIRLLIKGNPLKVVDVEAEMLKVPVEECKSTLDTLDKIKGIEIKSGFSNLVRKTMGGKKGCTHLAHIVTVMGQEIVHGWLTYKRNNKSVVPEDIENFQGKDFILNSCRMWVKGGSRMKSLEQALQKGKHL